MRYTLDELLDHGKQIAEYRANETRRAFAIAAEKLQLELTRSWRPHYKLLASLGVDVLLPYAPQPPYPSNYWGGASGVTVMHHALPIVLPNSAPIGIYLREDPGNIGYVCVGPWNLDDAATFFRPRQYSNAEWGPVTAETIAEALYMASTTAPRLVEEG